MPRLLFKYHFTIKVKNLVITKEILNFILIYTLLCSTFSLPVYSQQRTQINKNTINSGNPSDKPTTKKEQYKKSNFKEEISFEPNNGQQDNNVKYVGHGLGYELFLTSNEAVMVFNKPISPKEKDVDTVKNLIKGQQHFKMQKSVLKMQFVDSNSAPKISPIEKLQATRNYLSDKKNTIKVPGFKKVNYENIYKGIGLVFYSKEQDLEYDFVVSPNADVADIRIKFDGSDNVKINSKGELVVKIGNEEMIHQKPSIYQILDKKKVTVNGNYNINEKGEIGFKVGAYDKSKTLTIDPILTYSTYLGGDELETGIDIAIDKSGNAYITGTTYSSTFPKNTNPMPTVSTPGSAGFYQIFAAKFDSSGQRIFSTYWGGNSNSSFDDYSRAIDVDDSGNIYVAGDTSNNNFPVTPGALKTTYTAGIADGDGFVTKLNSAGTNFLYSTYLGGSNVEHIGDIAVDSTGNLFIAGYAGNDFPTTDGAYIEQISDIGGFVAKLNSAGSSLIYGTYLGGETANKGEASFDVVNAIAIDSEGNAYVTGSTSASDFPVVPISGPIYQNTSGGAFDSFVTKLNNDGSDVLYSTYLGGSEIEDGTDIKVDTTGNIYVVGFTISSDFITTSGAFQTSAGGNLDGFAIKLNSTLSNASYSTRVGGSGDDGVTQIEIDSAGNAFLFGGTQSSNFPVFGAALSSTLNGTTDGFISKLNASGTGMDYSTYFGGSDEDVIISGSLSSCGDVYITGQSYSSDYPTKQAYQPVYNGSSDAFLTKLTFLSTSGAAPDAAVAGLLPTTVTEYKLPSAVDTDVIDISVNYGTGPQPLEVELWASVYRPATLTGSYPLLVFMHGMHSVCERNTTPENPMDPPPAGFSLTKIKFLPWYTYTGSCDNPNTTPFDESIYYDVVPNHRGYDYLGNHLASLGYVVVSINTNRGIHASDMNIPDAFHILPRAYLLLRHLQKLKEWNDCTTNPSCQTPTSLGVDLRGKLDFSNVGFLGHSRGGQAVRAAYNKYTESGSVWQSRIPGLSIKGIFEIGPTDFETQRGLIPNPASKFIINGTKWNILLPMCDADVYELSGMNSYDRMLLGLSDVSPTQKSTYTVWGANHNFYNTVWNSHDGPLFDVGDYRCIDNDPLFDYLSTGSSKQRQTAIASVTAFFKANVGTSTTPNFNQNFNPLYDLPSTTQNITRIERGFTPSPSSSLTTVFEDFSGTINSDNCSSGTNTCNVGGAPSVSTSITNAEPYHDSSLKVLNVNWTSSGNDKSIQMNWRSAGVGADISGHQTLDFRIARTPNALNADGSTNFSIQLVMANGNLSNAIKLCNYAYVDGPVGGYKPVYNSTFTAVTGADPTIRPVLQTVRIPLAVFSGVNLSQIRGIKITFNESSTGSIFLTNFRFTK